MADEEVKYVYYKKNVDFSVGIRFFPRDNEGMVLNGNTPYVNIDIKKERDFIVANKLAIANGLIIKIDEPSFDFVTENTISDDEANELVKNLFLLRKKLPLITSEATVSKLYNAAKKQKRAPRILELIDDRLAELSPVAMQGISLGTDEDLDELKY